MFKYYRLEDNTRMWICNQCEYKNQDSSRKCHGCKNHAPPEVAEQNKIQDKFWAFCPKCDKKVIVSRDGLVQFKPIWKCHGCGRRMWGSGKPEKVKVDQVGN